MMSDLDEIRRNALDGETFPDWTLEMVDEIQRLRHKLDDAEFELTDARLGRWSALCIGAAAGAALAGLLIWILG